MIVAWSHCPRRSLMTSRRVTRVVVLAAPGRASWVARGPAVAAADPAGHALAIVGAVDVIPARVTAERACAHDVPAVALAFVATAPGHAVALRAGHDDALAGWADCFWHCRSPHRAAVYYQH